MKKIDIFPIKKTNGEIHAVELHGKLDVAEAMAKYIECNDQIARLQFQKEKHREVVKKAMKGRKKILVAGMYATRSKYDKEMVDKQALLEKFGRDNLIDMKLLKYESVDMIRIDKKKGAL